MGVTADFRLGPDAESFFDIEHRASHADGYFFSHYKTHGAGQLKRRMTMSENVTLFPNILQPAAAWKAYAPIVVKFWENQETALEDLKEFADGWFVRRHEGMQVARLKRPNILAMPRRPPIYSRNIRTGSGKRWNCWRRTGKPTSNKC